MAPPNRVLLPSNLDQELGDLRRQIHALNTAGASPQPRCYSESVDNAHPMYLDFVIPSGVQIPIAKLSFKFRLYRTTSSFAGGNTGGESATHNHGHAHSGPSHNHTWHIQTGTGPASMQGNLGIVSDTVNAASDVPTTNAGTGNTGSDSTANNVDHTHSIGASSLGVAEGTATTISALLVDGVDKTSTLGGPWLVDKPDLDISGVLPLGDGLWHTIQLTPAGQGRIVVELKLAI